MSQRTERVADLVRAELSEIVRREMRDPRVELAVVSAVEVTRDLAHATVRISALGSEAERAATLAAFERARGFLRRELARRLTLRTTPELHFALDRGAEHSLRVAELLERAKSGDGA
jgi:ribosome-binding factor A